ncbi:MAG TPA: ABC transporter substrate-binding protein [Reyranella sp.]|nr:ABC transporter substrate-binding protein [Reyranella sp.]
MPTIIRMAVSAAAALTIGAGPATAQKKYDPGASDSEIKLGQTMPYSGPLSGFITLAKAELAYFAMVNDQGGVNGRKVNLISLDDGYSPPKTVEQTRRLVEVDQVLAISGSLGTPTNAAVQKYLNARKVPQLFLASGASRWNDPKNFPYTMTLTPIYTAEAAIYAAYVLKEVKDPKVAVLYQNDDFGKDFLKGFKDRLGDKAGIVVREVSYEVTDATVDSQIIDLASTKANVFLNVSSPKFAVQAIRKVHELGWKPLQFIDNPAASIGVVMRPAGIEASTGIVSAAFVKDPTDPKLKDDPEFQAWVAWMKKYYPAGSLEDPQNVVGYVQAQAMVQVLKQCGDTLTRDNVMKQAANLRQFHPAMLLKGINMDTSPTDYQPMEEMLLQRFNGTRFEVFGELLSARVR